MFSRGGFNATKLKASLRLASSRFDVATNKKSALMKQNMREVALLLAEDPPKEEKARIRTERLIKDDYQIEAFEILQLECQLLIERVGLLKHSKECPADLASCVSDLIYAAPRVEIPELHEIKNQLVAKFGKTLALDADNNKDNVVSQRIVEKLSLAPPTAYLVQTYMIKIAKLYEVDYEPTAQLPLQGAFEPVAAPVGYSVPVAQGTGLGPGVASVPPSDPDFDKSTIVKAFAFAPEGGINDKCNQSETIPPSVPTASRTAKTTAPPTPEGSIRSNVEDYTLLTGLNPAVTTEKEPPKEANGDKATDETIQEETEIVEVEYTPPQAEAKNPDYNPTWETDEKNVDSISAGSDAVNRMEAWQSKTESLAREAPPDPPQATVLPAPEEETGIAHDEKELYGVLTGFSSPVHCKKEQEDAPKELEGSEPRPSSSYDMCDDAEMNEDDDNSDTIKSVGFGGDDTSSPTNDNLADYSSPSSKLELLRTRFDLLANPTSAPEETAMISDPLVQTVDRSVEQVGSKEEGPCSTLEVEHADCKEEHHGMHCEESIDKNPEPTSTTLDCSADELVNSQEYHLLAASDDHHCEVKNDPVVAESARHEDETESRNDENENQGNLSAPPTSNEEKASDDRSSNPSKRDKPSNPAEHITGAALAGGAVGFAVAGSLGGLLGAAGVAHLASRPKGKAAALARNCGKKVSKMTHKLVDKMEGQYDRQSK